MFGRVNFAGVVLVLAVCLVPLSGTRTVRAADVLPGWDLLETQPGTTFAGAPFEGVPLGTFDFGGTIGVKPVGLADTIVQRLGPASLPLPPGVDVVPIELVALQLVSVNPIDIGSGLGFHYITLQSERGGPASAGNMTINFDNSGNAGTFDSFFDVFFDIRLGALNGPIIFSDHLPLQSSGTPWDRTPPAGAVVIPGVNRNLNGINNLADFWPVGPFSEAHPSGAIHTVDAAGVPLPSAAWGGLAMLGIAIGRRALHRRVR